MNKLMSFYANNLVLYYPEKLNTCIQKKWIFTKKLYSLEKMVEVLKPSYLCILSVMLIKSVLVM